MSHGERLHNGRSSLDSTVLVIAAHADDEVLGCGGTIAKHVAKGDAVQLVLMADGVSSRTGGKDSRSVRDELTRRNAAADRAHAILRIEKVYRLGLPDNRMDSVPLLDVVQSLEAVITRSAPDIIYTHHFGDLNVDHRITHQAVVTACRPVPDGGVRELLTFEVPSSTEWASPSVAPFKPNTFVDITEYLSLKMQALDAYKMEMRPTPHSRSLEHLDCLARHRGNCVGVQAAEAFEVIRMIR
jgi:LmbE family N-acetylglucosaminyl deacetylase